MTDINLINLPVELAEALGISTFAGQILCSCILGLTFLLPLSIWGSFLPTLIVGIMLMGFFVTIQWLPAWTMIMITLIVAGIYGLRMRELGG